MTLIICQTHTFLPHFCQFCLKKLPLNVFSVKIKQQRSWWVEYCSSGNMENFVSQALFVPFFAWYVLLRYSNFVSWFQVLFFLASLLNFCALCEIKFFYMFPRDFIRCQSCYTVDSRNNCVEERLHFVYTAIRPFVLQTFADDIFEKSNIALCKSRFCFKVCDVGANSLDFRELFDISFEFASFIRPYFQ